MKIGDCTISQIVETCKKMPGCEECAFADFCGLRKLCAPLNWDSYLNWNKEIDVQ